MKLAKTLWEAIFMLSVQHCTTVWKWSDFRWAARSSLTWKHWQKWMIAKMIDSEEAHLSNYGARSHRIPFLLHGLSLLCPFQSRLHSSPSKYGPNVPDHSAPDAKNLEFCQFGRGCKFGPMITQQLLTQSKPIPLKQTNPLIGWISFQEVPGKSKSALFHFKKSIKSFHHAIWLPIIGKGVLYDWNERVYLWHNFCEV